MARRYEEPADVEAPDGHVVAFWWRGRRYRVQAILSCWREAGGWWESGGDTAQPWARGEAKEIWRLDAVFEPDQHAPVGERVSTETRVRKSGNVSTETRRLAVEKVSAEPFAVKEVPAGTSVARTGASTPRTALRNVPAGTPVTRHPAGRKTRRMAGGTYDLCRDLRKGSWTLLRVWD